MFWNKRKVELTELTEKEREQIIKEVQKEILDSSNVRFQLLRPKTTNYKDPNAMPVLINVSDDPDDPKQLQDMEIICEDYPLKMPMILYNQGDITPVMSASPMIVFQNDLYGIYQFVQVDKDLINIFVLYAGDPTLSPLAKYI